MSGGAAQVSSCPLHTRTPQPLDKSGFSSPLSYLQQGWQKVARGKNWQAPVQVVILGENQRAFLTPGMAQGPDLPRTRFPAFALCHVDTVISYENLSVKTKWEILDQEHTSRGGLGSLGSLYYPGNPHSRRMFHPGAILEGDMKT